MRPPRPRPWVGASLVLVPLILSVAPSPVVPGGAPATPVGAAHQVGEGPGVASVAEAAIHGPISRLASAVGGQGRLIVNTTDPAVVPNSGVRTNITDYFAYPLETNSAFQVGVAETIGDYVAVFGIFQNDKVFPVPFFSVFSNVTDQTLHLAYWSNLTLVGGQSYDFALTWTSGTNWTLRINGALFASDPASATFDFGTTQATWGGGLSFSEVAIYSAALTTPATLDVPLAFAVEKADSWYLPQTARSFLVTGQALWGAAGRLQNGTLAPGELRTGQAVSPIPNGTELWTGGPVPVSVGLGLSETMTRGTTIVEATATVYAGSGTPVAGVPLSFSDLAHSTFAPASGVTNGRGMLTTFVGAPNVSANVSDTVVVTVTLLGYFGEAQAVLTIIPPTQLFLSVSPPLPATTTGSTLSLSVAAVDSSGNPGAGVLLLVTVLQGRAAITPFATTDASGKVTLVFSAPSSPSVVPLVVLVVAPGYWGHLSVNVTVVSPPPTLLSILTPYIVGAGVALAGVGAILLVLWQRRRSPRQPIPRLGLDVEESTGGSVAEPVSRTRP